MPQKARLNMAYDMNEKTTCKGNRIVFSASGVNADFFVVVIRHRDSSIAMIISDDKLNFVFGSLIISFKPIMENA